MSSKEIGIVQQSPTDYEFNSNFDGEKYYLRFQYNNRNDIWYLTILDSNQVEKVSGIALLTNVVQMISRFSITEFMSYGDLIVSDASENKKDPTFDNFGDSVSTFYTSVLS